MVHPGSHRISHVLRYSGIFLCMFSISPTRLSLSMVKYSKMIRLSTTTQTYENPTTPRNKITWFGLYPLRSPLLRVSLLISFPLGTEMFHFPRFALIRILFQHIVVKDLTRFPHSEISGS